MSLSFFHLIIPVQFIHLAWIKRKTYHPYVDRLSCVPSRALIISVFVCVFFLLRQITFEKAAQRLVGCKCLSGINKRAFGNRVLGINLFKIAFEVARIKNCDRSIVRNQILNHGIGIGILEDQKMPVAILIDIDMNDPLVHAKKELVLILLLKGFVVKDRGAATSIRPVDDILRF